MNAITLGNPAAEAARIALPHALNIDLCPATFSAVRHSRVVSHAHSEGRADPPIRESIVAGFDASPALPHQLEGSFLRIAMRLA